MFNNGGFKSHVTLHLRLAIYRYTSFCIKCAKHLISSKVTYHISCMLHKWTQCWIQQCTVNHYVNPFCVSVEQQLYDTELELNTWGDWTYEGFLLINARIHHREWRNKALCSCKYVSILLKITLKTMSTLHVASSDSLCAWLPIGVSVTHS